MLLPADLLSSTLMPWALAAPALPLLFMLTGRIKFSGLNVAILMACIIIMLTNMFYSIVPKIPVGIRNDIHLVGIIIECSLSLIMVWNMIHHPFVRKIILAFTVTMVAGMTILMSLGTDLTSLKTPIALIYFCTALLSGIGLFLLAESRTDVFITDSPVFWAGAGITFHFGLMSCLIPLMPDINANEWASLTGFSLMYTISNTVRYILYAAAVYVAGKFQVE